MFGYVNNSTGDFHLFATWEAADAHAREAGLTRVSIRQVIAHDGAVTGIVNQRARAASTLGPTMDAFLAGGQ